MRIVRSGAAAAALLVLALPGIAQACGDSAPASFPNETPSTVFVRNEVAFAVDVLWSDFDGALVEYGLLQPFEEAGFDTYLSHLWYLEVYTPEGSICFGPIEADGPEGCEVTLVEDAGGIALDLAGCLV